MLIAAFIAVASWAVVPVKKATALQPQSIVQLDAQKKAPKLVKPAAPFKVTTPVTNRLAAKAKANARKAPKKDVSITDLLAMLNGDYMLCSNLYEYDEEENDIVSAVPAAAGTPIKFKLIDATTIGIEGFTSYAEETIKATFSMDVPEELAQAGVVATATIANNQTLYESTYGPVLLSNAEGEDDLTVYILGTGSAIIANYWYDVLGGDGQYAGFMWSGNYYTSVVFPVNGTMTWGEGDDAEEVLVYIYQDEETPKYVQVYNFAGEETAIYVTMKTDQTFKIEEQEVFYYDETYGYFCVSGLLIEGGKYYLDDLTGVGTENTLTFDGNWMIYSPIKGSIYEIYDPATITLTTGEFAYPEPVADVAATPADPEILAIGNYDKEDEYGYVAFTVPVIDVDGNDLSEDKLYYVLYSDINGVVEPITFTPDLYIKLEESMTEIPYTFTDNYDFADKGSYKVVFLNYNFNTMYDRIGLQSIYKGGGETNKSEIVWEEVEKAEPVVLDSEITFDFNAMDVPTSVTGVNDGDITEDKAITEGSVTLTISPSTTNTPNRFWSTTAGPQLRVYSGTLTFEVPEGNTITQIVFNHNGKWGNNTSDSGEITNDADAKAATWTGEAQKVVFTIGGNTQINNIVVTVEGGEPGTGEDVLVELPQGVTPIEYTLEAAGETSQGYIDIEGTMLVAFNGTDVYLQGLAYYFPDAYVKGKLVNGQVIVPTGQFVGEDSYGPEYIVALGDDGSEEFTDEDNIVFDYDAESGVMTLVGYYGESGTKDSEGLWDYFYEAVYTPGAFVLPDPVVAPEGLETETWYLACESRYGKIRANEVQVGFADGEVYIQGLCEYLPEAWVKGTISGNTATFASGQFYGTYNDTYNLFFVGYDSDEEDIADVVFTIDNEAGTMTTDQWIILNGKQSSISYYDYYYDVVISKEKPEVPDVVEAPEDLVTEPYQFKGYDTYYEEDVIDEVQVGFYGDNQVYIQGLSYYIEDAWVVGTLDGNTLTIPETYLGVYQGLFSDSEVFFSGATFVYDAEAGTFSSENGYVTYETPDDTYWMDEFSDVVLTKLNDVAATPADPEITEFKAYNVTYPKVTFNIPLVDVDGKPLMQSKLAYQLFIDSEATPLVLTTALYEELDEDMSEIPYGFSDGWDIYTSTVYLNQGEEVLRSWSKIGIQSIYYGGGECNKSEITWFDVAAYWENIEVGIKGVETNSQDAVYFDLQGRKVTAAQKGLVIMQVRNADGTVKNLKVVRK